jgi:hypothetical protein
VTLTLTLTWGDSRRNKQSTVSSGRVPESNSLGPSEINSQRNSPELETVNVLVKCLKNCRYLSNAPRLIRRLLCEQSGGLYTNSGRLAGCFDYTWQQDAPEECKSDPRRKSEVRSGVRIVSR